MDVTHFFQSISDGMGKIFIPNQVLESISTLKAAVILVAISILISSLALLILVISHYRSKNSLPIESDLISIADKFG